MRQFFVGIFAILGLSVMMLSSSVGLAYADKLVMFDSKRCPSCIKFKREMAKQYWKSALGKELPLSIVRSNSRRAMARYEDKVDPIIYTPTFVLLSNGEEVARTVGYSTKERFLAEIKRMRSHWNQ